VPPRRKEKYAQEIVELISIPPGRLLETFRLFLLLFRSFAASRLCVRSTADRRPSGHREDLRKFLALFLDLLLAVVIPFTQQESAVTTTNHAVIPVSQ
jgi:hypothetical protein